jgi:cupin 2 domain-containing protein
MTRSSPRRPVSLVSTGSLSVGIAKRPKEEQITELASSDHVRIERIVSHGHTSGPDDWYDEEEAEWVMVVSGAARLVFEGEDTPRALGPGDYAYIPPRKRHRVDWTDPDQPTVWLAVHFS